MRTLPTFFNQVNDLNEIIFAHRNRQYGAYELRKHYNNRLLKALLVTTSSLLLLLLISFAMHKAPEVIVPFHPADRDTLKTITIEEVKVHQTTSQKKHTRTEQAQAVIVDDSTADQKPDSVKVPERDDLAMYGDTSLPDDKGAGKGIAVDTFSSGNNIDSVFRGFAEVMPSFPGGDQAFARYIQNHFNCDGSSIYKGKSEGKIVLRFVIMNDGSLLRVEILRNDVGLDCANEAKNILLNSPKWYPGLQNKKPVNVQLVLPITIIRQ